MHSNSKNNRFLSILRKFGLGLLFFFLGQVICLFEVQASDYASFNPITREANTDAFAQLQSLNPDVRGWISIYGTQIDYPLLQASDNKKYLSRNALGEYVVTGSIFMDYRSHPNFEDFNTIIYGHYVPSGAMFGEIKKFVEPSFFENHKYGSVYYQGKERGLEIFGVLEVDAYDFQIYKTVGHENNEDQRYYQYLLSKAKNKRNVAVSSEDKIVLLSTCFLDVSDGRHILLAKLTDTVHLDPFAPGVSSNQNQGPLESQEPVFLHSFDFLAVPSYIIYLLVLILLLLVLLLLVILFLLLRRSKKEKMLQ